jgi:Ni,Fe-hydrogenase III component G
MTDREEITGMIEKKLGRKVISSSRTAPNRFYLSVSPKDLPEAVKLVFDELRGRYVILSGVDTPPGIEVLYHFAFDEASLVVTLRVLLDKENPEIESITPIVKGAEWIEREIHELLGVDFTGHPNMRRLILADDWPEGVYPLRRSFGKDET